MTLAEGPMTDARDALRWAREVLPSIKLKCSDVKIDGNVLAAIGWSTGGTLAMSLGFTARPHGIKPPDVILTFYSPTNYEDDCAYPNPLLMIHSIKSILTNPVFKAPNYPKIFTTAHNDDIYDLLEAVQSEPVSLHHILNTIPPCLTPNLRSQPTPLASHSLRTPASS